MKDRKEYEHAFRVFRLTGGEISENNYPGHRSSSQPYRLMTVHVDAPLSDAPQVALRLAEAAVEVGGYLTMHVHESYARVEVSVSCHTDEGDRHNV